MSYSLFTDGGCAPNPGIGAISYIIKNNKGRLIAYGAYSIGEATNNVAEYMALSEGLRVAATLGIDNVNCYADSMLLVRSLNAKKSKSVPHLQYFIDDIKKRSLDFTTISFSHIPREENFQADALIGTVLERTNDTNKKTLRNINKLLDKS